ncbi:hypothetical protein FSPOR_8700 [Fusarium sporotrichioides]|uniref:Uncharacterized protein n=1 Tax=Fusarium sporotrichioides TaxID=5514 RepID=A0A395RU05_FUSSP|nr:hypothetical protein FSPOR_8700 [Fusarium sporotrichioides]
MHNNDDSDYEMHEMHEMHDGDDSDHEMHDADDEGDKSFDEDDNFVQDENEDEDEDENFIGDEYEDEDENFIGDEYEDEYGDGDGDGDEGEGESEDEDEDEDEDSNDCHGQCEKVFEDRKSLWKHAKVCAACPFKYKQCRATLLKHLSMIHGILANSVPYLLRFFTMEVYGYQDMTDPGITYINVAQHLATITYPDISRDLQGLCEVSPKGPRRNSMPSSSYIWGKLSAHADFMKEEDILPYNLHKLALKPNYNGSIRYREGIRCPGPCEALSCPSEKTLAIANTVLTRIGLKSQGHFYQPLMDLPMMCETCGALVDRSSVFTPVRKAVEKTLNRMSTDAIRTPKDALEFLSDPQRDYQEMTIEETEFLRDLKDQKAVYFTDTENAGRLLIQVSVVDSKGDVVFEGHVNHGCATVQEIWDLAMERNNGKLAFLTEVTLRRAFGPPSSKRPHGYTMQWVAEEFLKLRERAPADLDADKFLPPPSDWVSPMTWFQRTGPSLAGYSLGFVTCLYAPSDLVWKWHDATVDATMLFQIMSTRSKKLFERAVTVPPPSMSIQRLFEGVEGEDGANGPMEHNCWILKEEELCHSYIEKQLARDPSIDLWELLTGASYFLNGKGYYRTAHAINLHLRGFILGRMVFTGLERQNRISASSFKTGSESNGRRHCPGSLPSTQLNHLNYSSHDQIILA